jgi:hypothetical protein
MMDLHKLLRINVLAMTLMDTNIPTGHLACRLDVVGQEYALADNI